ncbi:MAG TPA: hypothetical protein VG188_02960 [Solirubrobacteraceae bacterium]|nr:hypothetical protein [Solirubrobacteraceae bacterium]
MRKHLTYANVTATLALVFAMSGGALAAKHYLVTKTTQISPTVLKSFNSTNTSLFKKLSKSVTVSNASSASSATTAVSATNATNATHATSANTATSATTATNATNATNATTASNALSLGGTPASEFTHSDCNSRTGQIKGFALVPAAPPSTFTAIAGYNCSGGEVEAKRTAEGIYVVKFVNSPVAAAVATVITPTGVHDNAFVDASFLAAGEFEFEAFNAVLKHDQDVPFTVIVP